MTMTPIVVRRPKVEVQPLDAAGAPAGPHVDVTADFKSIAITPTVPVSTITTFNGVFHSSGDTDEAAQAVLAVLDDTTDRWADLVRVTVSMRVWHRSDAANYRVFKTVISFDPSLYGSTDPATPDGLNVTMNLPVLTPVAWAVGTYPTIP